MQRITTCEDPRSRTYEGFIAAIHILAKYAKGGLQESFVFEAEHDVIYSHVSTEELTEESEDGILLNALGWHCSSEIDVWAYFT